MTATVTVHPSSRPRPTRPDPARPPARPRRGSRPALLPAHRQHQQAERLAAFLGRWYVDAQAGRVEVRRLRRLLTPTAEQRVMASVLRARARHRRGDWCPSTLLRVRRVVVMARGTHYEALALVDDGVRTVPVVAVLHATRRGWVVSELARPDDGLPALPPPVLRERSPDYTTS